MELGPRGRLSRFGAALQFSFVLPAHLSWSPARPHHHHHRETHPAPGVSPGTWIKHSGASIFHFLGLSPSCPQLPKLLQDSGNTQQNQGHHEGKESKEREKIPLQPPTPPPPSAWLSIPAEEFLVVLCSSFSGKTNLHVPLAFWGRAKHKQGDLLMSGRLGAQSPLCTALKGRIGSGGWAEDAPGRRGAELGVQTGT